MPNFPDCLGFKCMRENEKAFPMMINDIVHRGKAIFGYSGQPYFNMHYGWAQFIVRAKILDSKEKSIRFEGLDTHCSGICIWNVRVVDTLQADDENGAPTRRIVFADTDGKSISVANIVNADVLPSYLPSEAIKMQIIALPIDIGYFKDDEEFDAAQPVGLNGNRVIQAKDTVFPSGLLSEHPDVPEDIVEIRGTVTKLFNGRVKLGEEECNAFVDCIVQTQFGKLEVVHSIDQVNEVQRENIKVGAQVHALAVLSGDVAIDDYSEGVVHNAENALKLTANALDSQGSGCERMRRFVTEDFSYHSDRSGKDLSSFDDFSIFNSYVRENSRSPCHTHYATITQIDDGADDLKYPVGTRCLVLTYGKEISWDSIVFIDTDENNRIRRIDLSTDGRYHFKVDRQLKIREETELPPKLVEEAIFDRAVFYHVISDKVSLETVCDKTIENASDLAIKVAALAEQGVSSEIFAEAYMAGVQKSGRKILCGDDLLDIGSQFYKDYSFVRRSDTSITDILTFVYTLGTLYAGRVEEQASEG